MPYALFATALGTCGIAWSEAGFTRFSLPCDDEARLERWTRGETACSVQSAPDWVQAVIARVQKHLEGEPQDFSDVRYDTARVSGFQWQVYREALAVKSGRTCSYGEIAAVLDLPPGGSRAVAAALGDNPWPLLVPCHRVIGANGKMTGFSGPGGIRTKTRLLAIEGAQLLSE